MRKLKTVADNKINNRYTDVAKVVIEVNGKVYREFELEMASDGPSYAKAFVKQLQPQLKGKEWTCYISLLHY